MDFIKKIKNEKEEKEIIIHLGKNINYVEIQNILNTKKNICCLNFGSIDDTDYVKDLKNNDVKNSHFYSFSKFMNEIPQICKIKVNITKDTILNKPFLMQKLIYFHYLKSLTFYSFNCKKNNYSFYRNLITYIYYALQRDNIKKLKLEEIIFDEFFSNKLFKCMEKTKFIESINFKSCILYLSNNPPNILVRHPNPKIFIDLCNSFSNLLHLINFEYPNIELSYFCNNSIKNKKYDNIIQGFELIKQTVNRNRKRITDILETILFARKYMVESIVYEKYLPLDLFKIIISLTKLKIYKQVTTLKITNKFK